MFDQPELIRKFVKKSDLNQKYNNKIKRKFFFEYAPLYVSLINIYIFPFEKKIVFQVTSKAAWDPTAGRSTMAQEMERVIVDREPDLDPILLAKLTEGPATLRHTKKSSTGKNQ